jgi:ATP-dependent Clp protease ATP-binding subunit ClpC
MASSPREPDPATLCRAAERLATQRREPATTLHLLATLAATSGVAATLLEERGLGERALLDLARSDGAPEPFPPLLGQARKIALRMGARQVGSVHVLLALINDQRGAARRALDEVGVDVGRLRTQAMTVGLGLVRRRPRAVVAPVEALAKDAPRGVAIPFFPPPERTGSELRPRRSAARRGDDPAPDHHSEALTASDVEAAPPHGVAPVTREARVGGRFELDPRRFPTLCELGKNLTLSASRGELDPVFGRDDEIERTLDVLAKRHANSPVIIGPAGVGKTSVVRGMAQRIASALDVRTLDDRIVLEVPIAELLAGTGVRGALAARFAALKKEVSAAQGRIVLFFDEIHQLLCGEGTDEIAAELKLALSRGELPCIGATTLEEYRRHIDADAALSRRFTPVEVEEPSRDEAYLIVEALAPSFARHHGVRYDEEALALSINWSVRYLPARALPDKAIAILDLAGARVRRRGAEHVTPEAIAEVVAAMIDMPVERLLQSDAERMLALECSLGEHVVGHAAELSRIAHILRRNAAGLGGKRPIGTFLLLGPTGVGKTETAKAVAAVLFHHDGAMTRIDMSEYSEAHSVAKLIGAPPGYVGHEAGGQLTEAVRRRPYQVVLLDEIEKAHPDVLTAFLAVFDEGRMSDGRGRTVDFTNTVIMLTSNLGAAEFESSGQRRVGFGAAETAAQGRDERVVGAARAALAPELYNRIDEVLVFAPLTRSDVLRIAERLVARLGEQLSSERGVRLVVEQAALELLLDRGGYDPRLGARPMRRTLARLLEAPLAERLLRGEIGRGDVVLLGIENSELNFDVVDAGEITAAE